MKRLNDSKMILLLLVLRFVLTLAAANTYADFTFGEPVNLGPVINSTFDDWGAWISSDALCLYFCRPPYASGTDAIWLTTRPTTNDPWGAPVNLGVLVNWFPCKSIENALALTTADGLEQYGWGTDGFWGSVGYGGIDIWFTKRGTIDSEWSTPQNLGAVVNSPADEASLAISPDGLELYFSGLRSSGVYVRPGGYGQSDLWMTIRTTRNDPWGQLVNLGSVVNSAYQDLRPNISVDGLVLFFDSLRPGGNGQEDLYMTRRMTVSDTWQAPVNLGPVVNSPASDQDAHISADGSTLFFNSNRTGGHGGLDLWQAPIIPICDFNGDGVVDIADVSIMIEHWQTDYPLCDIGPMPWGDGLVDAQDLMVLTKHLYESSRPKAHWKLDETEGKIAHDCVGKNHGTLNDVPVWRPEEGRLGGALEFHGIDDHVSIPFILDPAAGSFSVFAWIKCSERGKVIISQNDGTGTRWLWTDPSYGRLITWLMHPPFDPLISERTITDGQWHHIGLVFDFQKLQRYLYVDGARVAKDTNVVGGVGSSGGLYLGADKTLDAGSFFSGLIDDVRIYDKVLSAEEIAVLAQ